MVFCYQFHHIKMNTKFQNPFLKIFYTNTSIFSLKNSNMCTPELEHVPDDSRTKQIQIQLTFNMTSMYFHRLTLLYCVHTEGCEL
jgi:hypothetical protein